VGLINQGSERLRKVAYFSHCDFVSIEFLPDGQKDNAQFSTETVLPSIKNKFVQRRPKLRGTATQLHIDNARAHAAKKSIQKTEELGFIRVPHPPSLPGIAPCDFF
jgi:hypothetical protein